MTDTKQATLIEYKDHPQPKSSEEMFDFDFDPRLTLIGYVNQHPLEVLQALRDHTVVDYQGVPILSGGEFLIPKDGLVLKPIEGGYGLTGTVDELMKTNEFMKGCYHGPLTDDERTDLVSSLIEQIETRSISTKGYGLFADVLTTLGYPVTPNEVSKISSDGYDKRMKDEPTLIELNLEITRNSAWPQGIVGAPIGDLD